ncbi:hypothetical protein [Sulfolobus sp. S-194]|uniref:hypothetical protein n=1 Tax=Sulfolobus sp. S-194 TaxID=2512240 RepID=UPI00257064F1|nr:hypothetical protein [Sulfolobus sp. S-194]
MAKLVCMICEHEEKVPEHCGVEMEYVLKGTFRKVEYLKCKVCSKDFVTPKHCGIPMLYVDEDYLPVNKLSKTEIEEMRKLYSGE